MLRQIRHPGRFSPVVFQDFSSLRSFSAHRTTFQLLNLSPSFTPSQLRDIQIKCSRPPPMERPSKRVKVSSEPGRVERDLHNRTSTPLASLHRPISPPPGACSAQAQTPIKVCPEILNDQIEAQKHEKASLEKTSTTPRLIPSPIQLTHIRDLPDQRGFNDDTVKLRDILGDPMIRECWQFNYLFDVDFLMSQFDEDVRNLVKVKVVHGSWEREAANRIRIDVSLFILLREYIPLFSIIIFHSKTCRM